MVGLEGNRTRSKEGLCTLDEAGGAGSSTSESLGYEALVTVHGTVLVAPICKPASQNMGSHMRPVDSQSCTGKETDSSSGHEECGLEGSWADAAASSTDMGSELDGMGGARCTGSTRSGGSAMTPCYAS
jgi:hypothetical protein